MIDIPITGFAMDHSQDEVTTMLHALRHGDRQAEDKLFPLVYAELHRVARSYMRRERANHTLQPTAFINEAYLRLAQAPIDWQSGAFHWRGGQCHAPHSRGSRPRPHGCGSGRRLPAGGVGGDLGLPAERSRTSRAG